MKKSVSLLLILLLVLSTVLVPARSLAEEEKEEVNNTITCEWQDNNKTLVVKGKGRLAYGWARKVKKWYSTCNRLIIEKGITSISSSAFNDLESDIESIKLPEGLQILEEAIFSAEYSLKKVELPSTLEKIEDSAFSYCKKLESIRIPGSVTYIGDYAFSTCQELKSLKIPDSVTHIGEHAFFYCSSLRKITLPKSLQVCKDKFEECPVTTIVNRSSLSLPLDNNHKRKTWYVNGKKKNKVPAGKTAKAKGKKYKIKYNLRGGKAKCKLPKTYRYGDRISFPMKKVTKKNWYLIRWDVNADDYLYPSTHGTVEVHPVWIKYKVKNVKGKKIKIYVRDYKRLTEFGFIVRYATKKDMSNAKYYPKDGWGNDFKWGKKATKYTLKGLKKGKKYYIEIAPRHSEDIGDWYGKRCVKVKK